MLFRRKTLYTGKNTSEYSIKRLKVATGAGHNSVMQIPGTDNWLIVYNRRPIPNGDRDHRVTCIDKLEFNDDGTIKPVKMTFERVSLEN